MMKESQIIEYLTTNAGVNKEEAKRFIRILPAAILKEITNGKTVQIRNVGSFSVRNIKDYVGVHPVTKVKTKMPGTTVPFYKASEKLKQATK